MTSGCINFSAKASKKARSAAADRDDDFQAVAAGERRAGVLAARDDFAVFLDGDALARKIERLDQLRQGERCREAAGFAVDDQFNHDFYPDLSFSMMPDSTLKHLAGHEGAVPPAGTGDRRGRRIVALPELPKLMRRVRFPSPAPLLSNPRSVRLPQAGARLPNLDPGTQVPHAPAAKGLCGFTPSIGAAADQGNEASRPPARISSVAGRPAPIPRGDPMEPRCKTIQS